MKGIWQSPAAVPSAHRAAFCVPILWNCAAASLPTVPVGSWHRWQSGSLDANSACLFLLRHVRLLAVWQATRGRVASLVPFLLLPRGYAHERQPLCQCRKRPAWFNLCRSDPNRCAVVVREKLLSVAVPGPIKEPDQKERSGFSAQNRVELSRLIELVNIHFGT